MYAWSPSTSDWKKPGAYKFDDARKPYLDKLADDAAKKGPRTYNASNTPNMKLVNTVGKTITSDSENPIVVAVDVTGSMSAWPREIFDRLPLMYQTLSQYRPDVEICFAAIGDAHSDNYPLQVNHFGKGLDLEEHIRALCPEGGGGGQISESYELFAYFIQEHCKIPKAKSPFLLIYGDEKFYNQINTKQVSHYIGDTLNAKLDAKQVFQNLMQKFNVYLLHKPYGTHGDAGVDKDVKAHWADAIGTQRIIEVPGAERAVDIAIGLVAKHWGEFNDFKENLGARHDDAATKESVYKSLRFVDAKPGTASVIIKENALNEIKNMHENK